MVAPEVDEGENKLQYPYSIWFTQRVRGSVSSAPSDYEDNIKLVGSFSSVSHLDFDHGEIIKSCRVSDSMWPHE